MGNPERKGMTPNEFSTIKTLRYDISRYLGRLAPEHQGRALCFIPGVCEPDKEVAVYFRKMREEAEVSPNLPILIVPDDASLLKRRMPDDTVSYAIGRYDSGVDVVVIGLSQYQKLLSDDPSKVSRGEYVFRHELGHAADALAKRDRRIGHEASMLAKKLPGVKPQTRREFLKNAGGGVAASARPLLALFFAPVETWNTVLPPAAGLAMAFVAYKRLEKDLRSQHKEEITKAEKEIGKLLKEVSADLSVVKTLGWAKTIDVLYRSIEPALVERSGGREAYQMKMQKAQAAIEAFCADRPDLPLDQAMRTMLQQIDMVRETLGREFPTREYPSEGTRLKYLAALMAQSSLGDIAAAHRGK